MSDNNEAQAYRIKATTPDGNPVEAYVLPAGLHSTRRYWTEEYGQVVVEPVTIEEMEQATGMTGLADEAGAQ
ncbi:hypothetical protein [Actinomycetia phage DSL-LC01]|nr:hypothetical protein [Actinomycetia phage DSL-LC01]